MGGAVFRDGITQPAMAHQGDRNAVIDLFPWPTGSGFEHADDWWNYVLRQTEADRLNLLLAMALLSEDVCQLLFKCDPTLLQRFEFSDDISQLLTDSAFTSLDELARVILLNRSSPE